MGRRRHDEQWWFYLQLFDDYAGTKTYAVKRQQFLEDSPDVLTTRTIASYLLAASKPPKKHTVTWVLYTTTPHFGGTGSLATNSGAQHIIFLSFSFWF